MHENSITFFFFLITRPPPRPPLFPYTTLFRSLLPGGRPVTDEAARAEVAAAWGPESLPAEPGMDVAAMLDAASTRRSEEHTSELQSRQYLVCRLLLEKKKIH